MRWRSRVSQLSTVLTVLLATAAGHEAEAYVSEGHEYTLKCSNDGYVLRSKYPVARFIEGGAASRIEKLKHEEIYLGKDCDAYHKIFGGGEWCWANGGFRAEFPLHEFGFPRQELYCQPPRPYEGNCSCGRTN